MSRSGEVSLHARVTERMQPGVVYTTFHHPNSGANVITTDFPTGRRTVPNTR